MEKYARLKELADRLIQAGPKAAFVSCSETHEINEGVFELIEKIAELETALKTVAQTRCVSYEDLAIRDLEQQAKGVEKAADVREINWTSGDRHTLHLLAGQLRTQARQLKE